MTDLFASLVDRALDRMPVLQRRQPTLFEPVAAFGEQSRPGNVAPLEEQEIVVEGRPTSVEHKHFVTNSLPQPSSRFEEPESEPIEAPRPRRHRAQETQTDQDNDRIQPVSLASVREQPNVIHPQAPPTHEPEPMAIAKREDVAIAPPREIETIVEKRVEREIINEHSTDKPSIKEVHVLDKPHSQLKPSRENDDAQPKPALKSEIKRETPETIIKPAVQYKPPPLQDVPRIVPATSRAIPNDYAQQPAQPVINVTIGRVEVRATSQSQTKAQPVRPGGPKLSLEDYLRSRGKGN